jgi:hypothetical protein
MNKTVVAILCVILVSVGAMVGFFVALNGLPSGSSSSFPEYLLLSEPEYSDAGTWFTMTINNTGISNVVLVKVLVNNVKQLSSNPSFPFTITPDHGITLNVTLDLTQSRTYQIDLYTSQGNKFSKLSEVPSTGSQAGVVIYKANTNFYNQSGILKIDVDIGDSGTQATMLIALSVGTSSSTLVNQTMTPVTVTPSQLARITINYSWTSGTTYFFRVFTSSGRAYDWVDQAPFNFMAIEQFMITNLQFTGATNNQIAITTLNTGTIPVTITEIHVNNGAANYLLAQFTVGANNQTTQTITYTPTWTNGAQYEVELRSSKGNQFTYTGTAPS